MVPGLTIPPISAQIKIWFQNRRAKWKRGKNGCDVELPASLTATSGSHVSSVVATTSASSLRADPASAGILPSRNHFQQLELQRLHSQTAVTLRPFAGESSPSRQGQRSSSLGLPMHGDESDSDSDSGRNGRKAIFRPLDFSHQ